MMYTFSIVYEVGDDNHGNSTYTNPNRFNHKRTSQQSVFQPRIGYVQCCNIFLRQCILRGGLPFAVELPQLNQTTLEAMAETQRIARDPDIKGYTSIKDLKAALESEE